MKTKLILRPSDAATLSRINVLLQEPILSGSTKDNLSHHWVKGALGPYPCQSPAESGILSLPAKNGLIHIPEARHFSSPHRLFCYCQRNRL